MNKLIEKYKNFPKQLRASIWFLLCTVLQKSVTIITTPIFTRVMSTTEYGQFNVFLSWQSIITCFVTLELSAGIYTQGLVKFDEKKEEYSSALQGLTLTLTVVWGIVYLLFRNFWNTLFELTMLQMFLMLGTIWTNAIFAFWASEQRVKLGYIRLVIVTFIASIVQPIISLYLVLGADDKVTARIWGICLSNIICYLGLFIEQLHKGKTFFSKKIWKYALKLSIPLLPHYLSTLILNSADRIMIANIVGDEAAGIYSLAYTIARLGILFNTALLQTISPWIYQKIKSNKIGEIEKGAYPALVIIAVLNLMVIMFAPEIVRMFAPPEYFESIWVIPPIAMSVYFMFAYNLFSNFEFYYEKTSYISTATLFGAVLNLILNYFCIEKFGYYAAGYTTLICYMVFVVFHYLFMRKICVEFLDGIRVYDTKKILCISSTFVILGFLFVFTYNYSVIRYVLIGLILILLIIQRGTVIKHVRSFIDKKRNVKW